MLPLHRSTPAATGQGHRRRAGLGCAILVAIVGGAPTVAAQTSKCMPADSNSDNVIGVMQNVVTRTDAGSVRLRQRLGLAQLPASQVTLVANATTCTKAAQAVDQRSGTPNPNRKVYVVKVGMMYVVVDGTYFSTPGDKVLDIVTSTFAYKSSMRL